MAKGDHLWVNRGFYTHHGIDAGDGTVIHFAGKPALHMHEACIVRTTAAEFAGGRRVRVRRHEGADHPDVVLARAESRVGESGYRLLRNNCEHFATWCCTGRASSEQVRDDSISVGVLALASVFLAARLRHAAHAPATAR
jgi:hypothetical protein